MQYRLILKILGVLLILFSSTMLPPIIVSAWYHDGAHHAFLAAYVATLLTGVALWWPCRSIKRELRVRDGFIVVVLFWTVLAAFGALPFTFADRPVSSLTDSFFESMSGLTTTGATVFTGLDDLPESIRYYRQQLQWLGGMGIIVLAVAIMPMLGIGGMQLYRAETPGPIKDNKLTPRITETAKALWMLYLGLTVACAAAYWLAGMSLFDAVGHSFSTVAIGGFSTHDRSLGYFDNPAVDSVAMVFMLLAGINFALHFVAWYRRSPRCYFEDTEAKAYLGMLAAAALACFAVLSAHASYHSELEALRHAAFQAISIATTTGFTTSGYHWWPSVLPVLLLLLSCVGGCAGSTAGGMKVIRAALLYKQGRREMMRLVHPQALMPIKLGGRPVPDHVIDAVWAFFSMYVLCLVIISLALNATGLDILSAFSAAAACLNNLGPGLGDVASNYASLGNIDKWVLCVAMLLGRLELFTLLILFTPTFWKG
jgi:trk system potassium uptake protein TrkH